MHGHARTLPRHKSPNAQGRGREHKHKCPFVFMRRRGAWASPKRSLVTRRPNVQGRGREHNHKCSYVFKTRRGAWARPKRSLVTRRPNVQRRHKAHTQMLVRLYDEERCMGTPETLPRHKTVERTRKGTRTKHNTNYWVEEATRIFIIGLKSRSRYYNGRDSSKTQARTMSMEDKRKMK